MTRAQYNWGGAIAAIVFALISLLAALNPKSNLWSLATHEGWGKIIIFIWAVFPPAFFWLDWVHFCQNPAEPMTDAQREIAKHTHDLARNIWLGLLGVVAFAFFKELGMLK